MDVLQPWETSAELVTKNELEAFPYDFQVLQLAQAIDLEHDLRVKLLPALNDRQVLQVDHVSKQRRERASGK